MEKDKKTVEKKEKNLTKKEDKIKPNNNEFYWIIGIMIFIIVALALIATISKGMNSFKYDGLTFTKEKFGEIPIFHYYYYAGRQGREHQYNIYLRIDPRKNNVSVTGELDYPEIGSAVYVSLNSTGFSECNNVLREMHTIADFLNGNDYVVKAGNPDEDFAKQTNITYATCESKPDNLVILITPGNETKIFSTDNCRLITVNNCELLPAIEKFITKSLVEAKKRSLGLNIQ